MQKKWAKNLNQLSFKNFLASACHAIGYHQGCFRLGLLSFSDVDTTIFKNPVNVKIFWLDAYKARDIDENHLKNNIFFTLMDNFEQKGLQETLNIYSTLAHGRRCSYFFSIISRPHHHPILIFL